MENETKINTVTPAAGALRNCSDREKIYDLDRNEYYTSGSDREV
jgi:hypothetical protein